MHVQKGGHAHIILGSATAMADIKWTGKERANYRRATDANFNNQHGFIGTEVQFNEISQRLALSGFVSSN